MITSSLIDYKMPKDEKDKIKYFLHWQNLHSNDHQKFLDVLNSISKALNQPILTFDPIKFHFNPQNLADVNRFLLENYRHHELLYITYNKLGQMISNPISIFPKYNLVRKLKEVSEKEVDIFLFAEERIHTLFARALNLMIESL